MGERGDRRQELHGNGREAQSKTHKALQRALGLKVVDDDIKVLLAHLVTKRQIQVCQRAGLCHLNGEGRRIALDTVLADPLFVFKR